MVKGLFFFCNDSFILFLYFFKYVKVLVFEMFYFIFNLKFVYKLIEYLKFEVILDELIVIKVSFNIFLLLLLYMYIVRS